MTFRQHVRSDAAPFVSEWGGGDAPSQFLSLFASAYTSMYKCKILMKACHQILESIKNSDKSIVTVYVHTQLTTSTGI